MLNNKLPEKLKAFATIIDGRGYAGRCKEVTIPKLARTMEEYRAGGMDRPVDIDMGGEKLATDFTLEEYSPEVLKKWAVMEVDGVSIRFKGSVKADDSTGDEIPVEVIMRGRFQEMDMGGWKAGDTQTMKVAASLVYFEYIYNGNTLIKIDVLGMSEEVDGVDRLSSRRANLST